MDAALCHTSHPASHWKNLIRRSVKWDPCALFLFASFINASQILPCCCWWTFNVNSGRDRCLQSSLCLNGKCYEPYNIVAEQNYRKLKKKKRTLEHEQGYLECCFWEGRECDALVYSQELEVVCLLGSLATRPVPLGATDRFASRCNKNWEPRLDMALGRGSQLECCALAVCLSWQQMGEDWPYIPKQNWEWFCCVGFKPIFAGDGNISSQWMPLDRSCISLEKKVIPPGCLRDTCAAFSFPLPQWRVTQLCHFCLSYNNGDRVTACLGQSQHLNPAEAWLEWASSPGGDPARCFSSTQPAPNEQDEEESRASPATRGVLNLLPPSYAPRSHLNPCVSSFTRRKTPGLLFSCSSDVLCREGKNLFGSNALKLYV